MKNVLSYLPVFITVDIVCTIIVGALAAVPTAAIITAVVIKSTMLFLSLGGMILLISKMLPEKPVIAYSLACVFEYLLIPVFIKLIKPGQHTVYSLLIELHSNFALFSFIYLPFLIAVLVTIATKSRQKISGEWF